MRHLLTFERRLQNLERASQSKFRIGRVKEVRFAKRRWFVRMEQTTAQGGGGGGQQNDDQILLTDWVPWRSFSHGSIQFSVPPRVNQTVAINSPNGYPEMSYCEPYHYDPDHPSPHDKENEVFVKLQAPTGGGGNHQPNPNALAPDDMTAAPGEASGGSSDPIWSPSGQDYVSVHGTKDLVRVMHKQAMFELTGDTIKIMAPNIILKGTRILAEASGDISLDAQDISAQASQNLGLQAGRNVGFSAGQDMTTVAARDTISYAGRDSSDLSGRNRLSMIKGNLIYRIGGTVITGGFNESPQPYITSATGTVTTLADAINQGGIGAISSANDNA